MSVHDNHIRDTHSENLTKIKYNHVIWECSGWAAAFYENCQNKFDKIILNFWNYHSNDDLVWDFANNTKITDSYSYHYLR